MKIDRNTFYPSIAITALALILVFAIVVIVGMPIDYGKSFEAKHRQRVIEYTTSDVKTSKLVRATKKGRARFESMRKQFLAASGVYAPLFTASEVTMATDVCRRAREVIQV